MNQKPKVIFKNVSKKYTLQKGKIDRLLELIKTEKSQPSFYALRNISFTVYEGETIGIIGINGSGKSTMSNLLAQVVPPTDGQIQVFGETSLIAIAVGLNNNLTGLENIELKCLMHGMKKEDIKQIQPKIIEFAELGDFIDQPVKSYSSGMKSRLGFAISAHTNPDIMVIDEALSVGDQTFYQKCINKMNEFKSQGKTIFFISHSASQVRSFCDRVIWLNNGELVEFGDSTTVIANYLKFIKWFNELSEDEKKSYKKEQMIKQKKENNKDVPLTIKTNSRKFRSNKQKKRNKAVVGQFIFLVTLFIFSTFLMLFNHQFQFSNIESDQSINNRTKNETKESGSIESPEKVDKKGYITKEQLEIVDKSSNSSVTLGFMDEVYVKEIVGEDYKVMIGDIKGGVKKENIFIPNEKIAESTININDFINGFPDSTKSAYEFYLLFLNTTPEKIEGALNGKTGEREDKIGNRYFSYGMVEYRINPKNHSDSLIIKDFSPDSINMAKIQGNSSYKSENEQFIFVSANDYLYILNLLDNELIIRLRGNGSL
ncbi:hypothetical protein WQ57_07340 [Mesobacillus campisalis]|uniref:ABC transporter domain-containing protein n=1 Tax=Mesobacillus campisalis TaxID=1408103 RepID=A0A0M2T1U2_9BACI|nr:ATP-binding cassette domain-containing protein [Mesobacillus campisalis]KKK38785.1 hypothetical protein WQ57_07340 [Mesobacillus campisalis]